MFFPNPYYDPNFAGDSAFLEDKFARFSYRFKFEDNEYSLMAPFSQPMFIPKQYSEFGAGQNPDFVDMDNAYKSTIVTWFENNIDNMVLKAPMPYNNPQGMLTNLLATEIDLSAAASNNDCRFVLELLDGGLAVDESLFQLT